MRLEMTGPKYLWQYLYFGNLKVFTDSAKRIRGHGLDQLTSRLPSILVKSSKTMELGLEKKRKTGIPLKFKLVRFDCNFNSSLRIFSFYCQSIELTNYIVPIFTIHLINTILLRLSVHICVHITKQRFWTLPGNFVLFRCILFCRESSSVWSL